MKGQIGKEKQLINQIQYVSESIQTILGNQKPKEIL